MQKTVSVLALAGCITLVGTSAAQAYNPPPAPAPGIVIGGDNFGLRINSNGVTIIIAGRSFTFGGGGFAIRSLINITIINNGSAPVGAGAGAGGVGAVRTGVIVPHQVVDSSTTEADADGNFEFPVTLEEAGTYTLSATGLDPEGKPHTVVSTVTVEAAATAPVGSGANSAPTKGGLAKTGVDSAMFLWGAAGIGALGLGAGSIVVARRRTGTEA